MKANMGQTKSTSQEVVDTGVVNSNFIVQQKEYNVSMDVKIMLSIITIALLILLALEICKNYGKQVKKRIQRNLVIQPMAAQP